MESKVSTIENYVHNSISEEHIKEGISAGYVKAIAHCAGFNIGKEDFDYGMDGTFSGVKVRMKDGKERLAPDGCKLDFQLKASINVDVEKDIVKYNLEVKNYNDLVDIEMCTPRILIVYKLPRDKKEWINVTENGTIFKDCAWWCYLSGQPETDNKEKIVIKIPRRQVFNQEALKELMKKVKKGELV